MLIIKLITNTRNVLAIKNAINNKKVLIIFSPKTINNKLIKNYNYAWTKGGLKYIGGNLLAVIISKALFEITPKGLFNIHSILSLYIS